MERRRQYEERKGMQSHAGHTVHERIMMRLWTYYERVGVPEVNWYVDVERHAKAETKEKEEQSGQEKRNGEQVTKFTCLDNTSWVDYEQIMSDQWEQTRKNGLGKSKANPNNKQGREASNNEGQIKEEEKEKEELLEVLHL